MQWIRERRLPVWANGVDAPHLRGRGLEVHELRDGVLGMGVEILPLYDRWQPGEPTLAGF